MPVTATQLEDLLAGCQRVLPLDPSSGVGGGYLLTTTNLETLLHAFDGDAERIRPYLASYCMWTSWKVLYDCQIEPLLEALARRGRSPAAQIVPTTDRRRERAA